MGRLSKRPESLINWTIHDVCKDVKYYFTFSLTHHGRASIMVNMKQLSTSQRCQVVRCLIEGNSIRSTVRITGVAKNTIVRLLEDLGCACASYHNRTVRNLKVR